MADEAPNPDAPTPPKRPVRRRIVNLAEPPAPKFRDKLAIASIVIVLAAGAMMVLVGGMNSGTRGARLSTKLQWQQRQVELDWLAEQAEKDGKLDRPHE